MKPVLKENELAYFISDYELIRFISENAPMGWNDCCKFIYKEHILSHDEKSRYSIKDIEDMKKNPEEYGEEKAKWMIAFFEAHPFLKNIVIVFDK